MAHYPATIYPGRLLLCVGHTRPKRAAHFQTPTLETFRGPVMVSAGNLVG